ncbi:MAG: hypothetical protein IPJ85_06995 [Flavobacteriales bacterium]|nr:hypothetical protein [Flavobacteriales bacterium]
MNGIALPNSEVVEGGKSDFKVRNISSSDFMIYIGASLVLAEFIARATERTVNALQEILEIKVLREELKKKGVPDKETKGIADHANGLMKEEIKRIVDARVRTNKSDWTTVIFKCAAIVPDRWRIELTVVQR